MQTNTALCETSERRAEFVRTDRDRAIAAFAAKEVERLVSELRDIVAGMRGADEGAMTAAIHNAAGRAGSFSQALCSLADARRHGVASVAELRVAMRRRFG